MRTPTFLALVLAVFLTPAVALALPHAQEPAAVQKSTINLNTATIDQLMTLPGIGRKTAERILEHRAKSGGFKKIEELMNVQGIGEPSSVPRCGLVTPTGTASSFPTLPSASMCSISASCPVQMREHFPASGTGIADCPERELVARRRRTPNVIRRMEGILSAPIVTGVAPVTTPVAHASARFWAEFAGSPSRRATGVSLS